MTQYADTPIGKQLVDEVEVLNTTSWTPQQALLAATKKQDAWTNIVIVGETSDGDIVSIAANCTPKDLYWLGEMVKLRAHHQT